VPLLLGGGAIWFWLLRIDPYGWEQPMVAEASSA